MAKPGRPKKNGIQPPWMLGRMLLVLHAFREAKSSGLKHCAAITETVAAVKKTWPAMRISETEVKRILAKYQPASAPFVFIAKWEDASDQPLHPEICKVMGIPEGSRMKNKFTFGFGPRPKYP